MKVIRKTTMELQPIALAESGKQAIALAKGDELEIAGALWRVLRIQDGKALIWKHTKLDQNSAFNHDNSNEYEGSDLQKAMKALPVPEALKDLISDDGFFALSIEEVLELMPTEEDRIAVDSNGETVFWWTRSAYRSHGNIAWLVYPSGYVYYGDFAASSSLALAPACAIRVI